MSTLVVDTNVVSNISFMTVAELDRWSLEARWGGVGGGDGRRQSGGRRIECADAWVAATAMLSGAPLLTHNRRDCLGRARPHADLPRGLLNGAAGFPGQTLLVEMEPRATA